MSLSSSSHALGSEYECPFSLSSVYSVDVSLSLGSVWFIALLEHWEMSWNIVGVGDTSSVMYAARVRLDYFL